MFCTLYFMAMPWLESVSTFPIFTFPAYAVASFSIVGVNARQGGHHSAQKSTSTGLSLLRTSASKFCSVKSITFSLAMSSPELSGKHPLTSDLRNEVTIPSNRRANLPSNFAHSVLAALPQVVDLAHGDNSDAQQANSNRRQRNRCDGRPNRENGIRAAEPFERGHNGQQHAERQQARDERAAALDRAVDRRCFIRTRPGEHELIGRGRQHHVVGHRRPRAIG